MKITCLKIYHRGKIKVWTGLNSSGDSEGKLFICFSRFQSPHAFLGFWSLPRSSESLSLG